MLRYLRLLIHINKNRPYIYIAAICAMIGYLMPYCIGSYVFGPSLLDSELIANLSIQQQNIASGVYRQAPEYIAQSAVESVELLERYMSTTRPSVRYEYAAQYYEARSDDGQQGLTSDDRELADGRALYCRGLARLDSVPQFSSAREMPSLLYLSFTFGSMPTALLYAPTILLALGSIEPMARGKLLLRAPGSDGERFAATTLVFMVQMAIVVFISVAVPFCVLATLRGIGDPNYPIVFVQAGNLMQTQVGRCAMQQVLLFCAGSLFLYVAMYTIALFTGSQIVALAISALMVVIPMSSGYLTGTGLLALLYQYLPMTYLLIGRVCGYAGVLPNIDQAVSTQIDPKGGIVCLLLWILACASVAIAGTVVRRKKLMKFSGAM